MRTGNEEIWFLYSAPLAASGPAVSVGTVGQLSLGENEVLYAVAPGGVNTLDVTASLEIQGLTCHPTSINSFSSDHCGATALPSACQAVSICGLVEVGAVEDYHMPAGPVTTSGVTEVVAMAEVSMTHPFCNHSD